MSVSDGLRQLCRPREQCQSIVEFPVDPEEVAQRDVKRRGGGRRCSSGLSPSIDDRDERVNTRFPPANLKVRPAKSGGQAHLTLTVAALTMDGDSGEQHVELFCVPCETVQCFAQLLQRLHFSSFVAQLTGCWGGKSCGRSR